MSETNEIFGSELRGHVGGLIPLFTFKIALLYVSSPPSQQRDPRQPLSPTVAHITHSMRTSDNLVDDGACQRVCLILDEQWGYKDEK